MRRVSPFPPLRPDVEGGGDAGQGLYGWDRGVGVGPVGIYDVYGAHNLCGDKDGREYGLSWDTGRFKVCEKKGSSGETRQTKRLQTYVRGKERPFQSEGVLGVGVGPDPRVPVSIPRSRGPWKETHLVCHPGIVHGRLTCVTDGGGRGRTHRVSESHSRLVRTLTPGDSTSTVESRYDVRRSGPMRLQDSSDSIPSVSRGTRRGPWTLEVRLLSFRHYDLTPTERTRGRDPSTCRGQTEIKDARRRGDYG